ncbi:hypothetical protein ACIBJF_52350 [Streptomyces sp. NPDC050743]|uniref:hypothetical protein n=1 Tax=Streptomyces sp. NPDC050743 TaxID=3365634 RepID=UPI0037A69781
MDVGSVLSGIGRVAAGVGGFLWRAMTAPRARRTHHRIVRDHIARYGQRSAQRLFTRELVAT